MRKGRIISFLSAVALFLFVLSACGIPRMFPWSETYQYNLNGSSLDFKLRFTTESSSTGEDERTPWNLRPSPNTPILRFYYLIVPEASMQSTVSGIVSSFSSRYSSSFPKSFESGEAAYTSSYDSTATDDETISVSLYELAVIEGNGHFEPASRYFQGIEWFEPVVAEREEVTGLADEYKATFSFTQDTTGVTNGYYLILTLNGEQYTLGRSNGQPFSFDRSSYYDDDDAEFLPEDSDGLQQDAVLMVYATASFAFDNYTTRATVRMDKNEYSYVGTLLS